MAVKRGTPMDFSRTGDASPGLYYTGLSTGSVLPLYEYKNNKQVSIDGGPLTLRGMAYLGESTRHLHGACQRRRRQSRSNTCLTDSAKLVGIRRD